MVIKSHTATGAANTLFTLATSRMNLTQFHSQVYSIANFREQTCGRHLVPPSCLLAGASRNFKFGCGIRVAAE